MFTPDTTVAVTGDTIRWVWLSVWGNNNSSSYSTPVGATPWSSYRTDTFQYVVKVPGTYYYDNNHYGQSCAGLINVSAATFTANSDTIHTVCPYSTVWLNPSFTGLNPPYTYRWHVLYGNSLDCYTCPIPTAAITQNSSYLVQVTDTLGDTAMLHTTYVLDSLIYPGQVVFADSFIHCDANQFLLTIKAGFPRGIIDWGDGADSNFDSVPGVYRHYYPRGGVYQISVIDSLGCMTIVRDTLPNMPTLSFSYVRDTVCSNVPYAFNGHYYDTTGIYFDTLSTVGGCDSIIELALAVRPAPVVTLSWDSLIAEDNLNSAGIFAAWNGGSCGNDPVIFGLKGGNPLGGIYSGEYVQNNIIDFDSVVLYGYSQPIDRIVYTYIDTNGCSSSAVDTILIHFGCQVINAIPEVNLFTLYPNPANDYVMIDFDAAHTGSAIFIKDITGRKVITEKNHTGACTLPVSQLPAGLYFVQLSDDRVGVGVKKLVVEH